MTKTEWLTSTDPGRMLRFLTVLSPSVKGNRASDRKLQLFSVACCRLVWDLLSPLSREAVEIAQRRADGDVPHSELEEVACAYWAVLEKSMPGEANSGKRFAALAVVDLITAVRNCLKSVIFCSAHICAIGRSHTPGDQALLLRDVINPFLPHLMKCNDGCKVYTSGRGDKPHHCRTHNKDVEYIGSDKRTRYAVCPDSLEYFRATHCTPTVLSMAQQAYDSRDYGALPILADALEEVGCTNLEVLGHCRGPGPHTRGCWVVDLILGKE